MTYLKLERVIVTAVSFGTLSVLAEESKTTEVINEILVAFTFFAMTISITACVVMYMFRDMNRGKSKKSSSPPTTPQRRKQETVNDFPDAKILSSSIRTNSSKKSSDKSSSKDTRETSSLILDEEANIADDSSGDESPHNQNYYETRSLSQGSNSSFALNRRPSYSQTFLTILQDGITMVLHTARNSRNCKLQYNDHQFILRIKRMMNVKTVTFGLSAIESIQAGKTTLNLQSSGLSNVSSKCCFSIVTAAKSYDFEVTSEEERNAIVLGLSNLLNESGNKTLEV